MAKYVQPNILFDSSVSFLRNVAFDSSVYFQGVTHINAPATVSSGTPFAMVLESGSGTDLQIKSAQLGTMAFEAANEWDSSLSVIRTDITNLETSVGALDTLTQKHDSSIGVLTALTAVHESSIGFLTAYNGVQDVSIDSNWQRWVDSRRTGFLNQTETTLSFDPGTHIFTVAATGSEWSYYFAGEKITITGNKTVDLDSVAGGLNDGDIIYITIEDTTGDLKISKSVWDLDTQVALVAYVRWNSTNTPSYTIGEERHTMLIDRQIHKYLHETRGSQYVSGGDITGPDVAAGDVTVTDASNAFGLSATEIADEDIFQTLSELVRPNGGGNDYFVILRNLSTGGLDDWRTESTPLPEGTSYIEYDNGTTMVEATPGKFVNTYVMFTNETNPGGGGAARFAILPGQAEFDDVDSAIDENPATFDFTGLPIAEYVVAYQLTWEVSTGYSTDGAVALASAPKRIRINATTASAISTESHNDLIGLQGGTATERYHLSLTQYNDYVGKSYVDASLALRDTDISNLESSVGDLDTLTQTHTADIAQLDASIVRIDGSLGQLNTAIQTNTTDIGYLESSVGALDLLTQVHDASIGAIDTSLGQLNTAIQTNTTDITNLESSVGALDTLTQTHTTDINNLESSVGALDTLTQTHTSDIAQLDASVVALRAYDSIQDASIALAVSGTTSAWNGLTRTDNSIGLGGLLNAPTEIITNGNLFEITGAMTITGDLTVDGSVTYINSVDLNVSDNIITLNYGETGDGVTKGYAGLIVDRGSSTNYFFGFAEATDTFRIGIQNESELPANTQAVATREDSPQPAGIPFWNGTDFIFNTNAGLTFTAATGLDVDNRITANLLTLQGIPNLTTEATALVIATDGSVGFRELGTMAFETAANYATLTYVDGSLSSLKSYVDGSLAARDTSIAYLKNQTVQLDASVVRIDAYQAIQDASIAAVGGAWKPYVDGSLAARDTSIAFLEDYNAIQDASIALAILTGSNGWNGLTKTDNSIGLGGSLIQPTTVTTDATNTLTLAGLQTGTTLLAVISDSGILRTQQLGTMALEASSGYYYASQVNTLIADVSTTKLSKSGGTMSGVLTFAAGGFVLDGQTITDINLGGSSLTDNNTTLPTSAAVIDAIESAIGSRITAFNGLTEYGDGSLGLGGSLAFDTSINVNGFDLTFYGLTNQDDRPTVYAVLETGEFGTTNLGTIAFTDVSAWDASLALKVDQTLFDTSIADLQDQIDALDASMISAGLGLTENAGAFDVNLEADQSAIGTELKVRIDTVGDNELYIDSADVATALASGVSGTGTEITTYENGSDQLSIDSNDVVTAIVEGTAGLGVAIDTYNNSGFVAVDSASIAQVLAPLEVTDVAIQTYYGDGGTWNVDQLVVSLTDIAQGIDSGGEFSGSVHIPTYYGDGGSHSDPDKLVIDAQDIVTAVVSNAGTISGTAIDTYDNESGQIVIDSDDIIGIIGGTAKGASNGLQILTDGSYGLGGSLTESVTTIATNGATNSLRITGLATSVDNTPFAIVSDTAGGDLKARELGSMAWATATDYVPVTGGNFTGTVTFDSSLIVEGVAVFKDKVYFDGSAYFTDIETIDVSSAYIHLNTGLTGAPPANLQSGIVVGRGSSDPYAFVYDETTQTFRIGIAEFTGSQYDDASTQAVATREDNPTDFGIPYWNETEDRFDTVAGLTLQSGELTLDGSLDIAGGIFLGGLGTSASETTALMILSSGEVVERDLGTNAFSSVEFASKVYVDGSLATRDAEITAVEGSITDLSTGKLDAVANINAVGDASILSYESDNVAYLKKIVGGTGATITEDASTITIAVTGASGYMSKYTGTFNGTTGTSFTVLAATHSLGTGPFTVAVYENDEMVYTGVEFNGSGDVTFTWSAGSLTDTACKFIISG